MKVAVIVLLAFVAMVKAQVHVSKWNPNKVHVVDRNPSEVHVVDRNPSEVHVVDRNPSEVHVVDRNPSEVHVVNNPKFDLSNVDPGFYQPHDTQQPDGGPILHDVDSAFSRPHNPGGFQQPNAEPEYVRNPDGSYYYANQQNPYPYRKLPFPGARGGN
ncbi:uncharacterized protein [Epargyreus clarus]|uniref:uncharacterized protein isoform X2 n=1 Tax=Epargyreus clarus TaxID=520877 RepID=UPI003C2BBF39